MFARHGYLVDRIVGSSTPLVFMLAPAGYGKSLLVDGLVQRFRSSAVYRADPDEPPGGAFVSIAKLLGAAGDSPPGASTPQQIWHSAAQPSCIVIDAADRLVDEDLAALLRLLLDARPPDGCIVVCSRREALFPISAIIEPHLAVVLRRKDFEMNVEALREVAREERLTLSAASLYRVLQLSNGWPEVALYLLRRAAEGRLEEEIRLDPLSAWSEILDWIDINVIETVPREVLDAILFCVACPDARPSDFDALPSGGRRVDEQLCRDYQLAEIGIAGELCVLPAIRWFFRGRRRHEVAQVRERAAADFIAAADPVRAARALVCSGKLREAEALFPTIDSHVLDMGNFVYPGATLEALSMAKPPYGLFPSLWFGLVSCRLAAESPATLAAEGDDVVDLATVEGVPRCLLLCVVSTLHALAGDASKAKRYVELLEREDAPEKDRMVDFALSYVDAMEGRYGSAYERWRRCKKAMSAFAAWFGEGTVVAMRAAYFTGNAAAMQDSLNLMLSATQLGGSPQLRASGIAYSAQSALMLGDGLAFERHRSALERTLLLYDLPRLWQMCASFYGDDIRDQLPVSAFDVARNLANVAALSSSIADRDRAARAAVEAADAAGWLGWRIGTRIVASACDFTDRETLLHEAAALADQTDSQWLRESVRAYVDGSNEHAFLRSHVDRIRAIGSVETTASATHEPEERRVYLDITSGSLYNGRSLMRASLGTLALVVFLSTNRSPRTKDAVLDALWPELDAVAALNAFKMAMYRARSQLGDPSAIVSEQGRYMLGPAIGSNFEQILALASDDGIPSNDERSTLVSVFDSIMASDHCAWAPWEWFAPYRQQIDEAAVAIGRRLVRDALAREAPLLALRYAKALVAFDPLAETPRRLVIEILLAQNDQAAALEEYRSYSRLLKEELGAEPSSVLADMVA